MHYHAGTGNIIYMRHGNDRPNRDGQHDIIGSIETRPINKRKESSKYANSTLTQSKIFCRTF